MASHWYKVNTSVNISISSKYIGTKKKLLIHSLLLIAIEIGDSKSNKKQHMNKHNETNDDNNHNKNDSDDNTDHVNDDKKNNNNSDNNDDT